MSHRDNLISIYSLSDPDTGSVRYVGRSHNPEQRLKAHLSTAKDIGTAKEEWLYFLKLKKQKPILTILERVPWQASEDAELWWLFYHYDACEPLTNQKADIGRARQKFGALPYVSSPSYHEAVWSVNTWQEVTLLSGSQEVRNAWVRQTVSPFSRESAGIFRGILSLEEIPSLGLYKMNIVNQAMLMPL